MEYLLLLINLSYGYLLGFILRLIRYPKISYFKEIVFSFFYIGFYIKLIDVIMINTNLYLIAFVFIGFYLGYQYYYQKSIYDFYELIIFSKKLFIMLIKPPFIKIIHNKIASIKEQRQYYKKHPYLKRNKYELF